MTWDAIVIGSGAGGLTAAVALARSGQRVLVLEQHYLPGGWMHSFSLGGHRFSPGVHYVGQLHEGGWLRRLYEGLGVSGELEFCELNPDGFDHFVIEGQQFDQPRGRARWVRRLSEAFPHERAGIARYFSTLDTLLGELPRAPELLTFPSILTMPWKAPQLLKWGLRTPQALLDHCVSDRMLKAILSAQCGNHGLAPSRVSLPLHAMMTSHYDDGAFYPRGGAKRIPLAFIKELRRNGGQIRVRTRVSEILVEGRRVVGVRTAEGERIDAGSVVCNADPAVVFGSLLPAKYCGAELRKVRRSTYSVSQVSAFCVVELDLKTMGYDSGNYWLYRSAEVDRLYRQMEVSSPADEIDALFLAISSLKDPPVGSSTKHTIELFTFVPYSMFERWNASTTGERDSAYHALKASLGRRLIRAAEELIPNLHHHLRLLEVGTPLTNDHYCETFHGAMYGTAKTPWQFGPFSFSQQCCVEGLQLCGASTTSHGVAGASMSGLLAAMNLLRLDSVEQCLRPTEVPLRIFPAEHPEQWQQLHSQRSSRLND